ncbi:MAG: Digeranylgeranylglycerophospholipid reductase [Candidatus Bathyarchaeota archaeon BA1]|nr:MAG: Digeranylgeranylglycerophospholipid reductase [Candidatus Bathyarchaeota archaeon BA1]
MKKFDVIVVGAGTGGCMAARVVAEAGLDVCLIDRKRKEGIGKKICADAIGKHHFDNLGLDYPGGEELERKMVGAKVYSPDMETVFCIRGEGLHGFILNRHLFGQRLLRNAIDAGATLLESTQAVEPIIKNGFVAGVLARDLKNGSKARLHSQVVVDASGYSAVLRKKLPPEMGVDVNVSKKDVEICYREIRELKETIAEPDLIKMYINQKVAPGGYYWIFPEGGTKVNVGLGVAMTNGFPNPRNQLYDHVLSKPLFKESKVLNNGIWYLPTRRSLDCMAGNGILIVGDAACQTNPTHGGGMGPSMVGGAQAGKTIAEAIEGGDVSQRGLWPYNVRYMQSYGAKQAGLDIFRMFLQGLCDDDLNYGMKYRLITEGDILKTSMGEDVRLNITEATLRIFRGLGKLSLLKKLRDTANLMKKVKALYQNYPSSPKGFDEWRKEVQDLIKRAESRFKLIA